jgi:16S rRNA G1207 methylase RsmC
MTQLEENLNKILEEHQHESGLHMIGGRRRLMDRLVEFFQATAEPEKTDQKRADLHN